MKPGKAIREGLLVVFYYKYLQIAMQNFSNKLGGEGFGSVFKETLSDSTVLAIFVGNFYP